MCFLVLVLVVIRESRGVQWLAPPHSCVFVDEISFLHAQDRPKVRQIIFEKISRRRPRW
jgi:hypothetical protein